jgi:hypothetical protein
MVGWNYFSPGDVVWAAKVTKGITVVTMRGSMTPVDFLRDLDACVDPFDHDALGPVHSGFMDGMEGVWNDIKQHTDGPRVVIGHSLGAARATILTGLMVLDGHPPLARVVWGEPKSGTIKLAKLVRQVPGRSYRNGDKFFHDPVTDVPLTIPLADYVRATPLIDIHVAYVVDLKSHDWHKLPVIGFHNMALYDKGMSWELTV